MNTNHQTFLLEYYRTGDKKQAYGKAYPKIKEHCITNSVNRLLARPDIAEALCEQEQQKQAQRKAIEAEIAEQYRNEVIDYYEAQAILSQIIRGTFTREKAVKQKDGWTTITVTPTIAETLRALGIYLKNTSNKAPSGSPQGGEKDTHKTCPPPWGELEGASSFQREPEGASPHPFGDIYPKEYPGPYYDPADPNTKEKLQNLRLNQSSPIIARKNDEAIPRQQESTINNNSQQTSPVIARHEAISQQQEQALNTRDCFATARNCKS